MSFEASSPDISQVERHGYLFGHPIAHSMSPLLHQTVYDNLGLNWSQIPLDSTDMNMFLNLIKHPQFYGELSFNFEQDKTNIAQEHQ
jgi:quinate dehydrogenase